MSETVKMPKALGEYVLTEVTKPGEKKVGSIIIPNATDDTKPWLIVRDKGPDVSIAIDIYDQIEVVDMPRISYFIGPNMEQLALIHQKHIACAYK